jgi:hypothetical protein
MSDDDPERNSFEDVARALADEVSRVIERLSELEEVVGGGQQPPFGSDR